MKEKLLTVRAGWAAIHDWLDDNAPSMRKKPNKPASERSLAKLEKVIGAKLPEDFKASYRIHNGSDDSSGPIIGIPMLSLDEISKEWEDLKPKEGSIYQTLDRDVSFKKGMIKEVAANPRWIPFAGPDEQNYIGLDYDPGPKGTVGQVINFGADEFIYHSNRFVLATSFRGFMDFLAQLFVQNKVEVADNPTFLQLRKRRDGHACNLLTGLSMLFNKRRPRSV